MTPIARLGSLLSLPALGCLEALLGRALVLLRYT